MSFIKILTNDQETFTWHFTDPETEEKFDDTTFTLRMMPRDHSRRLERKHTTRKRRRGVLEEELDKFGFADDMLDYCIVGWEGVKGMEQQKDGSFKETDITCTRDFKLALSETVKGEIGRLCFGRHANVLFDNDDDDAAETDRPPAQKTPVTS